MDDLLIVIGGDSLHVDTCAFDACVLRQPLELDLNLFRFFGVKRVTGSVVDLPVAVSIFTEYGCRNCRVFGAM